MKRFKRGHARGGTKATKQGELALKCRQCLRPGTNIPEDWDKINPFYRWVALASSKEVTDFGVLVSFISCTCISRELTLGMASERPYSICEQINNIHPYHYYGYRAGEVSIEFNDIK